MDHLARPLPFTVNDVLKMCDSGTFTRGHAYYRQGRVRSTRYDSITKIYDAQVAGSSRAVYEVELYWTGGELQTVCDCPVGVDCKHGVAAALKLLESIPTAEVSARSDWRSWLQQLPTASPEAVAGPRSGRHQLRFDLEFYAAKAQLRLRRGYVKKDGHWSQLKDYYPDLASFAWHRPEHVENSDVEVLRLLHGGGDRFYPLEGPSGRMALNLLLRSGRFFHRDIPVQSGPPRTLHWEWQPTSQNTGERQLVGVLEGVRSWLLVPVEPPAYCDPETAQLGTVVTAIPTAQLPHLLEMPAVPKNELVPLTFELRRLFSDEQLPPPIELNIEERREFRPRLTALTLPFDDIHAPALRVGFDYGDITQGPAYEEAGNEFTTLVEHNGTHVQLVRDLRGEFDCMLRVSELGFQLTRLEGLASEPLWLVRADTMEKVIERWQQVVAEELPKLQGDGWLIEYAEDFDLEIRPAAFELDVADAPDNWFDFSLSLPIDGGRQLETTGVITHWLEAGAPEKLLLYTGSAWIEVDAQPLQQIRDLLTDLLEQDQLGTTVRLPGFQAHQLDGIVELDERRAPVTRRLKEQLRDFRGLKPVPVPAGLRAELRDYQQRGLDWLAFLQHYGFGGILADDMGLGKTLQTLALVQHMKISGQLEQPALVVAPTSLTGNWQHEAASFTPQLRVTLIHGPDRAASFAAMADSDLIITSYALLMRDLDHYSNHHLSLLILDEAQAIKNPSAKIAGCVRSLNCASRLCLTGTPLENHLGELWALMDFALPGLLGGRRSFSQHFRTPIEKNGDTAQQRELGRRLAPFMLRRTKSEVAAELPPKTESVQYVELEGKQRALYEAIRISMEKHIRELVSRQGMARSHIQFLDALLKLRQACIDPSLVKVAAAKSVRKSAKLDWLAENLPQLVEEGRRVLLFSQFTQALKLVEDELKSQQIAFSKLTGKTRKRQEAIDRFQSGEVPVFLISLKAGGSGLNLTAADVVIHLDPWWNPAVENQATDRAHRLGQDKPVMVYKLVASNSVEERILRMQEQKQGLADALFDSSGKGRLPRDSEELLALLSA